MIKKRNAAMIAAILTVIAIPTVLAQPYFDIDDFLIWLQSGAIPLIQAENINATGRLCIAGNCWQLFSPSGVSKWIDQGSYLEPNTTFADDVRVANLNVTGRLNVSGNANFSNVQISGILTGASPIKVGSDIQMLQNNISAFKFIGDGSDLINIQINDTGVNATFIKLNNTVIFDFNDIGYPPPDYDSGWLSYSQGEIKQLTHNLNTLNLKVDMQARQTVQTFDNSSAYGYWTFHEGSGTSVSDSSTNSRDGTTQNMTNANWVAGKLGNALQFNGINQTVNFGDIADQFGRLDDWSLEAWINTSATGTGMIMSRQNTDSVKRGFSFFVANGNLHGLIANTIAGNNRIQVHSTNTVNNGAWHHVVMTYSGSSTAAGVNFYIDGALETPVTIFDTLTGSSSSGADFIIGARGGAIAPTANYFNGTIDDAVIYEKELTLGEVQARYNAGAGRGDGLLAPVTAITINNKFNGNPNDGFYVEELNETFVRTGRGSSSLFAESIRTMIWKW